MRAIIVCFFVASLAAAEPTLWIGPPRERDDDGTTFAHRDANRKTVLRKSFEFPKDFSNATVRISTDFCDARILVNGNPVHVATPYHLPLPVDIRRHCRPGKNDVEVRLIDGQGPVAVAVELQLTLANGRQRSYHSDAAWAMDGNPDAKEPFAFGAVDDEHWWHVQTRPTTSDFDEYNQWKEAKENDAATAQFQLPEGFEIDTVMKVPKESGSWISLTQDDHRRLIVGKEKQGIVRLTLKGKNEPAVESINKELKGIHGMEWSDTGLFVNASDDRGFYRLRDTNGDDQYDEVELLKSTPGGKGDHGRNDLIVRRFGPRIKQIYSIQGDAVDIPDEFTSRVPVTHEFKDGRPKGGHLIRTDVDGSIWEVFASGLRNPYGIASNRDGEMFTYDADSERHVGLPWYRPTRMNHLIAGADYGWRSRDGERPWPMYHADSLRPNVLIGRGSPTSAQFGYDSDFPTAYRDAMFVSDWAFGRVFAVHIVPRGASYSMHPEVFLRGRPLNVCDIEFVKDDGMYLLTGGYGTQSVLYRIRYTGQPDVPREKTNQMVQRVRHSQAMRNGRRSLMGNLGYAWGWLDSFDPWMRAAARLALEREPNDAWQERIWKENNWSKALPALLGLVRVSTDVDVEPIWALFATELIDKRTPSEQLIIVRISQWLEKYHDTKAPDAVVERFGQIYPSGDTPLDRELCSFLSEHDATGLPRATLAILATDLPPADALHFLMALSKTKKDWGFEDREEYFRLLDGARLFKGDEGMSDFVANIARDALENVPDEEREKYAQLLKPPKEEPDETFPPRKLVKTWVLDDFADEQVKTDRNLGKRVFREAQCAKCHRLGRDGRAFGPDLTGIASRYTRTELLESILQPSRIVSSRYVNHVVVTNDGKTHTGQLTWNGFRKSIIRIATDPMRMDKVVTISKKDIESQTPSTTSPMPKGLLDTFTREEIESLIDYIASGGR